MSRLSEAARFVFLLRIVPQNPFPRSSTMSIFSVIAHYVMSLSEDDISTTCHDDGVLARSSTQFIVVAPFSPNDNERTKKMYEPSSEGRALAYVRCSIAIEKSFEGG